MNTDACNYFVGYHTERMSVGAWIMFGIYMIASRLIDILYDINQFHPGKFIYVSQGQRVYEWRIIHSGDKLWTVSRACICRGGNVWVAGGGARRVRRLALPVVSRGAGSARPLGCAAPAHRPRPARRRAPLIAASSAQRYVTVKSYFDRFWASILKLMRSGMPMMIVMQKTPF